MGLDGNHGKEVQEVAHHMVDMLRVEHPSECFGGSIRHRKDTRKMLHDNISVGIRPVLNGKMLDINVTRLFSGDTVVDHIDGRRIVFVKQSGEILEVF